MAFVFKLRSPELFSNSQVLVVGINFYICQFVTRLNMDLFTNQPHKTQLIITALAASLATASLFQAYNTHTKRVRRRKLDQEIRLSIASHTLGHNVPKPPSRATTLDGVDPPSLQTSTTGFGDVADYDEDLIREQLARNYAFFGEKGMERIREGKVVVVGCGGVGSWAAVMLVRSYVIFIFLVASLPKLRVFVL